MQKDWVHGEYAKLPNVQNYIEFKTNVVANTYATLFSF